MLAIFRGADVAAEIFFASRRFFSAFAQPFLCQPDARVLPSRFSSSSAKARRSLQRRVSPSPLRFRSCNPRRFFAAAAAMINSLSRLLLIGYTEGCLPLISPDWPRHFRHAASFPALQ